MSESLAELLRRAADSVREPRPDVAGLVAEADRRLRRRRLAVAAGAVGIAAAIVVGSLALRSDPATGPDPAPSPSPSPTVVDPDPAPPSSSTRPLVYAEGATVHLGEGTFEASKPVAFIATTDDGVVYEASLDGTLWFSDGVTTAVIGESAPAAAPTFHADAVSTGGVGSLVVWENEAVDRFVVYDTSRRAVVGDIAFADFGDSTLVYVDEAHVYFTPPGRPGCWALDLQDLQPCRDPHLYRFDVASGETTEIRLAELDAAMGARSRMFTSTGSALAPGFADSASFRQDGTRLVATDPDGEPERLLRTDGGEVRLRLPDGYEAPGSATGASVIRLSQWLDDDHVVLWATRGEGDLPPQHGDLLTCRLPDGVCRVGVPESDTAYVAPG